MKLSTTITLTQLDIMLAIIAGVHKDLGEQAPGIIPLNAITIGHDGAGNVTATIKVES